MPIIHTVRAIDWRVSHDLSTPLTARGYDITYAEILSNRTWDPTAYDQILLYKGEASPDLVRIKAEYDGEEREVMLGVVDRSGRRQTGHGVVGTLSGRDRMALVLDGYPATAFTINGITVVNNVPTKQTSYQEAVADIAARAGLAVIFDIGTDDYAVGKSIPVTTSTSYGKVLSTLLDPWRFSERFAHDAWVEGNLLRVVRRDLGVATISVNYERLSVTDYRKSRLTELTDVRVEGTSYETLVDDPSATCALITTSNKTYTGLTNQDSFKETTVEYRNSICQVTIRNVTRVYDDGLRTEYETTNYTYIVSPGGVSDGLKTSEVTEYRVSDSRGNNELFYTLYKKVTRKWTYYADDASTESEDETEQLFEAKVDQDNDGKTDGLNESQRTVATFRYVRSFGQLFRQWTRSRFRIEGSALIDLGAEAGSEVSPFKLSPQAGSTVPYGKKQETAVISAGAVTAKRTETSDMIGDSNAAALIRTRLLTEHGSNRVDISATMAPDHRVQPGRFMSIVGAPSWFDVTTFYVLSSDVRHDDSGAVQDIRAVAWL